MSKRGWRDDESAEFIPASIKTYGLPDDGRVRTDFDLIEMDEGRWHPNLWREAWKWAPPAGAVFTSRGGDFTKRNAFTRPVAVSA